MCNYTTIYCKSQLFLAVEYVVINFSNTLFKFTPGRTDIVSVKPVGVLSYNSQGWMIFNSMPSQLEYWV